MACDTVIDFYSEANQDSDLDLDGSFPCSGVGTSCAIGQCFTTPSGVTRYALCKSKFYIRKAGDPLATLWSNLYEISGSCGTDCRPAGDPIASTSGFDYVPAGEIGSGFALHEFNFPEDWVCLEPSTCYAITVHTSCKVCDGQNYVEVGYDGSSPTHDGNNVAYSNLSWKDSAGVDTVFYVYGEECCVPCGHVELPQVFGMTLQGDLVIPFKRDLEVVT